MNVFSETRDRYVPTLRERIFWYTFGAIGFALIAVGIWILVGLLLFHSF